MLDDMEKALKQKVTKIQSDAGSEFKGETAALLKKRNITHIVVRLGPKIEQTNAFLQSKLYNLIRQRRGGTLQKLIDEAVGLVNSTPSRILGVSPNDALPKKDSDLSKKFNLKRAKGSDAALPKISIGDTVRILKVKRKADSFFKSYRAEHYTSPYTVTKRSGKNYIVNGKSYPRDELLKVETPDLVSRYLIEERVDPSLIKPKAKRAGKKEPKGPVRRSKRLKNANKK